MRDLLPESDEAMIKGVTPGAEFEVEATLWEGVECRVRVNSVESA